MVTWPPLNAGSKIENCKLWKLSGDAREKVTPYVIVNGGPKKGWLAELDVLLAMLFPVSSNRTPPNEGKVANDTVPGMSK